ncbi:MAG: hypothetical protein QXR14_09625 [Sulfolobales archaeon]
MRRREFVVVVLVSMLSASAGVFITTYISSLIQGNMIVIPIGGGSQPQNLTTITALISNISMEGLFLQDGVYIGFLHPNKSLSIARAGIVNISRNNTYNIYIDSFLLRDGDIIVFLDRSNCDFCSSPFFRTNLEEALANLSIERIYIVSCHSLAREILCRDRYAFLLADMFAETFEIPNGSIRIIPAPPEIVVFKGDPQKSPRFSEYVIENIAKNPGFRQKELWQAIAEFIERSR